MATLGTIATTRQLLIGGTRRLTFAEFGDPAGMPVFFFHDLPATRLFRHPDDVLTAALGVRLITIDRPGVGLSDRQPGRTVSDWPEDVNALADVLQLGSFAVLGHAAGGPYAAACAYRLSGRVTKAAIVNGLPPAPGRRFGRLPSPCGLWPALPPIMSGPSWMLKFGVRLAWARRHAHHRHCQRVWATLLKRCSEPDCALFTASPALRDMMAANLEELFRASYHGYAEDAHALTGAWGFGLDAIRIPVTFWCGASDAHIPTAATQRMAQAVPRSNLHIIPDAGHYAVLSHWETILSDLHSTI